MDAIHPLFDLTGKVALVTGSGSGLGREFCDVLAEFGADVASADIHRDRAAETCDIIKKHGHRCLPLTVDVADYAQVKTMFEQVMTEFGRVDILVNNAGIASPPASIGQTDIQDWHRVIDTDLHGTFYCLKEGLNIMEKQGSGSVINISSMLGLVACDPEIMAQAPYVAAKAGIIGLTKQAAVEYGHCCIRVNCIAPGFHAGTRLPESQGVHPTPESMAQRHQLILSRTPLGRTGKPGELRGLLIYLAADSSSFVTGEVIVQDGGWTSW